MVFLHTEAVKRFDYDWAFLHVDSCVVLEPLGIEAGPKDLKSTIPWTPSNHPIYIGAGVGGVSEDFTDSLLAQPAPD